MTREEAIEILKDGELNPCVTEDREACDLAIKALEQQYCDDAVSRAEVINGLQKICDECDSEFCGDCRIDTEGTSLDSAKEMLKRLPLVTPTRKKGKWIFTKTVFDRHGWTVECSSCHKKWKTYDEIRWKKENKFCPNCGAEMESEE